MPPRGLKGKGAGRSVLGLAGLFLSETATLAGIEPFATWNTPIAWWAYILFLDGLIEYHTDRSFLVGYRTEFWGTCVPVSIATWTVFDLLNRRVSNWVYVGLPDDPMVRIAGYAASFATVVPGILLTAGAFEARDWFRDVRCRPWRVGPRTLALWIVLGVAFLVFPIVYARPEACPALWLFALFLVEPFSYRLGAPSLLRDLEMGQPGRVLRLAAAGLVCGLLWEFWNFWARAKWVYTIPYVPQVRLFEMPVVGYLGFIPFAWEVFAVYALASHLAVGPGRRKWLRSPKG